MDYERFSPFVLYIERISKNIKRIADEKMEPHGLRSSHVMCILQLEKSKGGLSSTALADACGVDKAFVSRITNELMEKKYIMKDENAKGKYKTKFVLTELGRQISTVITGILTECFEHVDARLSAKKLEVFYETLEKIDNGVSDLVKNDERN